MCLENSLIPFVITMILAQLKKQVVSHPISTSGTMTQLSVYFVPRCISVGYELTSSAVFQMVMNFLFILSCAVALLFMDTEHRCEVLTGNKERMFICTASLIDQLSL